MNHIKSQTWCKEEVCTHYDQTSLAEKSATQASDEQDHQEQDPAYWQLYFEVETIQ